MIESNQYRNIIFNCFLESILMFEIEASIPIPKIIKEPKPKRQLKYPFDQMEIGDSFFVPFPKDCSDQKAETRRIRTNVSSAFNTYMRKIKKTSTHLTFRVLEKDGVMGVRVWLTSRSKSKPIRKTGRCKSIDKNQIQMLNQEGDSIVVRCEKEEDVVTVRSAVYQACMRRMKNNPELFKGLRVTLHKIEENGQYAIQAILVSTGN